MKKELLKTDNYLLVVDDSEIKMDDHFLHDEQFIMMKKNGFLDGKKIIFHVPLNNLPILEGVPLLPSLEDDVNKLSFDYYENLKKDYYSNKGQRIAVVRSGRDFQAMGDGFIDGYNKAKEKYKFTEEDMKKASDWYFETKGKKPIEELIQSLSQPKMPTHFEFEMENKFAMDGHTIIGTELKTTTNSQGQVMACGKYVY